MFTKTLRLTLFLQEQQISDPLTNVDYNANLVYTFNSPDNDSALFRITASLKTDNFDPKGNDTLVYYQVFQKLFCI